MKKFVLVYQVGIANVFEVDEFSWSDAKIRNARRVYQGGFRGAEGIARGVKIAGAEVVVAHCDQAGDVANAIQELIDLGQRIDGCKNG